MESLIEALIINGEKLGIGVLSALATLMGGIALWRMVQDRRKTGEEQSALTGQMLRLYERNVDVLGQLSNAIIASEKGAEQRDGRIVQALDSMSRRNEELLKLIDEHLVRADAKAMATFDEAVIIRTQVEGIERMLRIIPERMDAQTQTLRSALDDATSSIIDGYKPALTALIELKEALNTVQSRVHAEIAGLSQQLGAAEQSIITLVQVQLERIRGDEGKTLVVGVGGAGPGGIGGGAGRLGEHPPQ